MDDKTFMAAYVANETTRISNKLKDVVQSNTPPSEEEKAEFMQDMEQTLDRLKRTLQQLQQMVDEEGIEISEEEDENV